MINQDAIERLLSRLDKVRSTRDRQWIASCPCPTHNPSNPDGDQNPSLSIKVTESGRILVKCQVGCKTDAVLASIGLQMQDLFLPPAEVAAMGLANHSHLYERAKSLLNPELLHATYSELLHRLTLSETDMTNLIGRGLAEYEIHKREYRTLLPADRDSVAESVAATIGKDILDVPGFVQRGRDIQLSIRSSGLLVPLRDLQGRINALKIRQGCRPKYIYLSGGDGPSCGSPIHVPVGITGPCETVRITEGELKADVATCLSGIPTIGVPGISNWKQAPNICSELGAKTVVVSFDAPDVIDKPAVLEQTEALVHALRSNNFETEMEVW